MDAVERVEESHTMQALPKDAPVMLAWNEYKATADYQNTRNWALHEEHVDGSLWAAFARGFALARSNGGAIRAELETQAVKCERFTLISGSKAAQRFRELLDRLPSPPDTGE